MASLYQEFTIVKTHSAKLCFLCGVYKAQMTAVGLMYYFAFAQTILSFLLLSVLIYRRHSHRGALYLALALLLLCFKQYLTAGLLDNASLLASQAHFLRASLAFFITPLLFSYASSYLDAEFHFFSRKNIALYTYSMFLLGVFLAFRLTQVYEGIAISSKHFIYSSIATALFIQIPGLVLIQKEISNFTSKLDENFSGDNSLHIGWLRFLSALLFILVAIRAADVLTGPNIALWKFSPLFSLSTLFALSAYSIFHSKIFYSVTNEISQNSNSKGARPLSDAEKEKYKAKMLEFLKHERPYLNPNFSLRDLSEAIGLKPYRTSELISQSFQSNFYRMVNALRVEHAQKILVDPQYSHLNMLGIANECGFNSKSVFNDAFKKITLKTPSEFRDSLKTQ